MEVLCPQQFQSKQYHYDFWNYLSSQKDRRAANHIPGKMSCNVVCGIVFSFFSIDLNGLNTKFGPKHITSLSIYRSRPPHFLLSNHNLKNTSRRNSQGKVFLFYFMPFIFFSPENTPVTLSPQMENPAEIFLNFNASLLPLKKAE